MPANHCHISGEASYFLRLIEPFTSTIMQTDCSMRLHAVKHLFEFLATTTFLLKLN